MNDPYAVLGVEREASAEEVAAAFRSAARATHPDTGGSSDAFAAVALAWEVLGDPQARAAYDAGLYPSDPWEDDLWGGGPAERAADDVSDDGGVWWSATAGEPRDDGPESGAVPADDPSLPRDRRGRPQPFYGPPVLLPVRPPRPLADYVMPRWQERLLVGCAAGAWLAVVPVVAVTLALRPPPNLVASPLAVGLGSASTAVLVTFVWLNAVGLGSVAPPRPRALHAPVWIAIVVAPFGIGPVGAVMLELALLTYGAVAALQVRRRRRAGGWQAAATRRRDAEVDAAAAARAIAQRWNRVRAAALVSGARLVRIGKPVRGMRTERRVREVGTWRRSVQYFTGFAQKGWWAVLDERGDVLALAPPDAPRRWSAALRTAVVR